LLCFGQRGMKGFRQINSDECTHIFKRFKIQYSKFKIPDSEVLESRFESRVPNSQI